jgi:hypothetical protein
MMTRLRLFLAAILACACRALSPAAAPSREPAIEFCDEELHLAHVEAMPDGSVLNVYLRPDETPETWHVMVALRHHPGDDVAGIVQRWRDHLTGLPPDTAVLKAFQHNTPGDQRFTLALHDETDTEMELSAVRFVPDAAGRGACFYEATVRLRNEKSPRAVEEALERQHEFAEALPKLSLAPVSPPAAPTEPAHAAETTPAH